MQEIGAIGKEHDLEINCILNNMEKYVAFMLGKHLVFMDRFQEHFLLVIRDTMSTEEQYYYDGQN